MTPLTTIRDRLAAPVVLVYWLAIVLGLVSYSAVRIDEPWLVVPLWIGAIAGTALAQCLALRDYRLWLIAAILAGVTLWGVMLTPRGLDTTSFWMALVPATLCGALSLGDRWSLAAFWFPVVLWMLSILDGRRGRTALDGSGAVLIAGLAVLFIWFLHAREARRVGLWRAVAVAPLATGTRVAVMREAPGRQLARAAWTMTVTAVAFAFTAWIAPHLWQDEAKQEQVAIAGSGLGEGGIPCCPAGQTPTTRTRVKEYFDLGRGRDDRPPPPSCVVCPPPELGEYRGTGAGGGPSAFDLAASGTGGAASGTGGSVSSVPQLPPDDVPIAPESPPTPIETSAITPDLIAPPASPPEYEPPAHAVPAPPTPETPREPTPPHPIEQAAPPVTTPAIASPAPAIEPQRPPPVDGSPLLRWLAVLVAGVIGYQLASLALRPLRRAITLRHLRRPFWSETVDQRVSNYWQLVLVGLRDAGWRTASTESPCELARRVGIDGVERCATILERTRHGVGIAADDLSTMESSAETAYRSGRRNLGPIARAVGWLRWPLA